MQKKSLKEKKILEGLPFTNASKATNVGSLFLHHLIANALEMLLPQKKL